MTLVFVWFISTVFYTIYNAAHKIIVGSTAPLVGFKILSLIAV